MRVYSMIIVAIQPTEITEMIGNQNKESDHRDEYFHWSAENASE